MAQSIQEKKSVDMDQSKSVRSVSQGTIDPQESNQLVVHQALEAIGMGRYQWQLLFSCGFGFLVDQMLLISITIIMPNAAKEFAPKYQTLLSASMYAGLFVGAVFCGLLADLLGRKMVWQLSIFGVSIVTMLAASSPNWAAVNVWTALCGLLAGGNLAIDLTVLAESLPRKWDFLLTGLASVWGLGNAITGLIAWPLVVNFCCPNGSSPKTCSRSENMGWRYLDIILGGLCLLMSIARSFALGMHESPKWLVSQGRIEEAVSSLNLISSRNKAEYRVDISHFCEASELPPKRTWFEELISIGELFRGQKKLRLMACLILLWSFVGICYPLYNVFLTYYLQAHGANLGDGSNYQTYRDLAISSVVGIPGPLLSAYLVRFRKLQHQGALLITSCICAIFAGLFTQVRTEAQNVAFSSMVNFWLNALYAVIYAYTPASLETKHRGIGCGMLMACGRLVSISAPFIATFGDVTSGVPLWISTAMYVGMGLLGLALPRLE
ncbi:major facilitator superfamily domain-containing protein [Aspergillus granulosus]|uniref:Major facilitator superfamily domain-containing protein n=1 Tax=Aspergillus granulosus TaxID=176169 RepID=A0ABR4HQF4_9EURO